MELDLSPNQTAHRPISHLVGPLSHSYAVAGFFPKSIEPLESSGSDDDDDDDEAKLSSDDEQDSVYNQSKYWLIEDEGLAGGSESTGNNSTTRSGKLNKQFLRCTQTMNLRNNFLYWDAKSKEKQQNQPPARQQSSDQQDDCSTKTDKQD